MANISVPLRMVPRRPAGHIFASIEGTVNALPVTITLTNDELHIQPHFEMPAACVDLMDIARAVAGEITRSQFKSGAKS